MTSHPKRGCALFIACFAVLILAFPASAQGTSTSDPAPSANEDGGADFDLEAAERVLRNSGGRQARPLRSGEDPIEARVHWLSSQHIRQCWAMPTGPRAEQLVVTVRVSLNQDGTLRDQPRVTSPRSYRFNRDMREAVESAVRAVRACAPYPFANDPVLTEHYDAWDEIEFSFRAPG